MHNDSACYDGLQVAAPRDGGLEVTREGIEIRQPYFKRARSPTTTEVREKQLTTEWRERILGLRATVFWPFLVTVVISIVVIVGLAAGLSSKAKQSNSSTSSSSNLVPSATSAPQQSSTTSTPVATASSSSLSAAMRCNGNGTSYTASTGDTFTLLCDADIVVNQENNLFDYRGIDAFDACMDACSLWNKFQTGQSCASITYGSSSVDFQHCWLKSIAGSADGANGVIAPTTGGRDSANLVSSVAQKL